MDGYPQERSWVYDRHRQGGLKPTFIRGVDEFIKKAEKQRRKVKQEGGIRCPCDMCMCVSVLSASEIKVHLYNHGFQPNYWYWTDHGEKFPHIDPKNVPSSSGHINNDDPFTLMQHMVEDALGPNFDFQSMGGEFNKDEVSEEEGNDDEDGVNEENGNVGNNNEEPPNKDTQDFYDLLTSVNQPLYEGASKSKISICVKLMACKTNWNVPQKCLDFFASMLIDVCPSKDSLPTNFYQAEQMVSMLGLKSQKIDCCANGCMLYYKDTITD
ncbi:hypothetical protein TSUD_326520 [Trifolium subterraneum]|uniref:Transposase-associated domain-containing protein n=1 Tax=Trifolium subterraneum TaxID=3900 RepID=A0A2Z6NBG1_TRISU|nr:hypothetical protein TSUD_326520 [Trifolium subterraneum]